MLFLRNPSSTVSNLHSIEKENYPIHLHSYARFISSSLNKSLFSCLLPSLLFFTSSSLYSFLNHFFCLHPLLFHLLFLFSTLSVSLTYVLYLIHPLSRCVCAQSLATPSQRIIITPPFFLFIRYLVKICI